MTAHYKWKSDGGGRFSGPGLSQWETARGANEHDAEAICRMLSRAFEAGRRSKAAELREVLGVHDTPWGVKVGG